MSDHIAIPEPWIKIAVEAAYGMPVASVEDVGRDEAKIRRALEAALPLAEARREAEVMEQVKEALDEVERVLQGVDKRVAAILPLLGIQETAGRN